MAKDDAASDDFDRDLPGEKTSGDILPFREPTLAELRAGILRAAPDGSNVEALAIAAEALTADNIDRALGEALAAEDIIGQPFKLEGWKWLPSSVEGGTGPEFFAVMAIDLGQGVGSFKGKQVLSCGALPIVTFLLWLQERDVNTAELPTFKIDERGTRSGMTTLRMRRADRRK
jgi:hypothetical protein